MDFHSPYGRLRFRDVHGLAAAPRLVSASMSARWQLILNGKSYDDTCVDDPIRAAVTQLRAAGVDIAVGVTSGDGDIAHLVEDAVAADIDCIIAAGGDGTLSAVASALAAQAADAAALPALALLPMGTANDFAAAAGIPVDPAAALQLVCDQPACSIDLLRVQTDARTHWCANLASGGFGTAVTVETGAGMKDMLGGLAYLVTGVAALGRIETEYARLRGPDFEWEGDFIVLGTTQAVQVANGPRCAASALAKVSALS